MRQLENLIQAAREHTASDLHLSVGVPPIVRVNGEILTLPGYDALEATEVWALVAPLLDEQQKRVLEGEWQLCFSKSLPELGYFRVSLYRRSKQIEASIRLGILKIPPFEELGLPPIIEDLARKQNGLVLIAGGTGSGKTTTLNAVVDMINRERRCKIITVEDPIEFLHRPVRSLVIQQEVGTDVKDFPSALIHALRQDPDVIALGELRELTTIAAALTAAETGHLVLATIHTNDAASTINRIVDVFPSHQQQQVRFQLSMCLQGIVNQRLLPRLDSKGRVLACEILIATEAVRNLIRESKTHQLENVILTGGPNGMLPMEFSLQKLYDQGIISFETYSSGRTIKFNGLKGVAAASR